MRDSNFHFPISDLGLIFLFACLLFSGLAFDKECSTGCFLDRNSHLIFGRQHGREHQHGACGYAIKRDTPPHFS